MLAAFSVRNLYLQRRRYALILAAISLGFALVVLMSSVSRSMQDALKDKASLYFAGHVSVVGYRGSVVGISDPERIIAAVRSTGIAARGISGRSVYYHTDAELFFGGESVRQRRMIGVDFGAEGGEFSRLSYASGGWEEMGGGGGILISESAARTTGARVGDDVTVFATTDAGQYTAMVFVVRGIFQESSLFGYVSYLSLADMNSLLGKKAGYNSEVAVFLKNPGTGDGGRERHPPPPGRGVQGIPPLRVEGRAVCAPGRIRGRGDHRRHGTAGVHRADPPAPAGHPRRHLLRARGVHPHRGGRHHEHVPRDRERTHPRDRHDARARHAAACRRVPVRRRGGHPRRGRLGDRLRGGLGTHGHRERARPGNSSGSGPVSRGAAPAVRRGPAGGARQLRRHAARGPGSRCRVPSDARRGSRPRRR